MNSNIRLRTILSFQNTCLLQIIKILTLTARAGSSRWPVTWLLSLLWIYFSLPSVKSEAAEMRLETSGPVAMKLRHWPIRCRVEEHWPIRGQDSVRRTPSQVSVDGSRSSCIWEYQLCQLVMFTTVRQVGLHYEQQFSSANELHGIWMRGQSNPSVHNQNPDPINKYGPSCYSANMDNNELHHAPRSRTWTYLS